MRHPDSRPAAHPPTQTTRDAQTLYRNRLCKCKPRAPSSEDEEDGASDLDTLPAKTAEDFSELISLCCAWEKDPRLASLALEGALCYLRSLKSSRPANANGSAGGGVAGGGKGKVEGDGEGQGEALEVALKVLAAAVGDFFGKKRGGGLTVVQVCAFLVVVVVAVVVCAAVERWCGGGVSGGVLSLSTRCVQQGP